MKNQNKTYCAGGVVINPKQGIAVVNQNNDSWSLPKGHIEKNEAPLDAAKREIYEETGIKYLEHVKEIGSYSRYRIGLDGKDDTKELKIIYMYLFLTDEKILLPKDPHNPEAIWCTIKQAGDILTHKKDKEFILENVTMFKEYLL